MSEQEFKPGDVVALKSGGPRMTVSYIPEGSKSAECMWFDEKKERQHSVFNWSTLRLVTEEELNDPGIEVISL
jgi:uncharacterized protein YodC (DUF2158 family)